MLTSYFVIPQAFPLENQVPYQESRVASAMWVICCMIDSEPKLSKIGAKENEFSDDIRNTCRLRVRDRSVKLSSCPFAACRVLATVNAVARP